jgi:hypothetical protein
MGSSGIERTLAIIMPNAFNERDAIITDIRRLGITIIDV